MRLNLKSARLRAALTQEKLGQLVNLTKQQISSLEHGRTDTRPHTWDTLEAILNVNSKKLRINHTIKNVSAHEAAK